MSILRALALCLAVAACHDEHPKTNVLFISIDTLRADRLGCYGYARATSPTIDAFAAEGTLFEQCFAHHGATWPSLTSIMTGKVPLVHGVRKNGDMLDASQRTLAEELSSRGFATAAFLTNMLEAPNRGFETKYTPKTPLLNDYQWDREITNEATRWLATPQDDRPFFAWVHLWQPHKPYQPPPRFAKAFEPDFTGPWRVEDGLLDEITLSNADIEPADIAHIQAQYDSQILSVDGLVKELLDALAKSGRGDDTLVVLFSDHGEELLDHRRYFFHSCSLYDGVLRIVLTMRLPGRVPAKRRVKTQVDEIDLTSTIYDLLDLAPPAGLQGESLAPLFDDEKAKRRELFVGEYGELGDPAIWTVRDGRWKYIHNPDDVRPNNPPFDTEASGGFRYEPFELYDLANDPREQKNVFAEHPDVAARLRKELEAWLAIHEKQRGTAGEMDDATRERMKQLGYIGEEKSPPPEKR
ncbi:MAG: sulfatase-like hydrolase/transferase [Planctomycetes bacterium]|nr:sulfatase-like hydrolase/transferase [Planctomycetota bacterium]